MNGVQASAAFGAPHGNNLDESVGDLVLHARRLGYPSQEILRTQHRAVDLGLGVWRERQGLVHSSRHGGNGNFRIDGYGFQRIY